MQKKKKVWEKASMIIAPFVEKNKPICPCQCKNSNEYIHTKKIDIFYTLNLLDGGLQTQRKM